MQHEVIASRKVPTIPGSVDAEVILCHLRNNANTPYVTWLRNIDDRACYWGHYFKTLNEAATDFEKR